MKKHEEEEEEEKEKSLMKRKAEERERSRTGRKEEGSKKRKKIRRNRPARRIEFKKNIKRIDLESIQSFIAKCFSSTEKCRLVSEMNMPEIESVYAVIVCKGKAEGSQSESGNEDEKVEVEVEVCEGNYVCAFSAELKEKPDASDIPYLLYYRREHTPDREVSNSLGCADLNTSLKIESVEKYIVPDLNLVYGELPDPRLQCILLEEKQQFYQEHCDPEQKSLCQQSCCRELLSLHKEVLVQTCKDSADTGAGVGKEEGTYEEVLVNGLQMFKFTGNGHYDIVGLDCEMVQTANGIEVGRVALVDVLCNQIYDEIVVPEGEVSEYFTEYSGLTQESFSTLPSKNPETKPPISYAQLINDLSKLIGTHTVIVGHSLSHDMKALRVYHTRFIDTTLLFSKSTHYKMKLKDIAKTYLHRTIQSEEHSPVVDAETAIRAVHLRHCADALSKNSCTSWPIISLKCALPPGVPFRIVHCLNGDPNRTPTKYPGMSVIHTFAPTSASASTPETSLCHGKEAVLIYLRETSTGWTASFYVKKV
ncbi:RNA exonuclease [Nematocida sp. AWRm77]|nr:RNA exonuclease [Nematocida sp. AWRm77]